MTELDRNPPPTRLVHQSQEIPLAAPESHCTFQVSPGGGLLVTPGAMARFGAESITICLLRLQALTRKHGGLDYLQVFEDPGSGEALWFIEDAPGLVTAFLPEER